MFNPYIDGYLLFAATTAIYTSISIFNNVLKDLNDREHVVLEFSILSRIVFFCMAFIMAPVMFFVAIVPDLHATFYETMLEDLNK